MMCTLPAHAPSAKLEVSYGLGPGLTLPQNVDFMTFLIIIHDIGVEK